MVKLWDNELMSTQHTDECSLDEFRSDAMTHLTRLASTGEAEHLLVDGQSRGVVMSPQTFEALVAKATLHDSLSVIDQSMQDVEANRGKDLRQAVHDIADELGLELKR